MIDIAYDLELYGLRVVKPIRHGSSVEGVLFVVSLCPASICPDYRSLSQRAPSSLRAYLRYNNITHLRGKTSESKSPVDFRLALARGRMA